MFKYLVNFFFKQVYFVSILSSLLILQYFYDCFFLNLFKFALY